MKKITLFLLLILAISCNQTHINTFSYEFEPEYTWGYIDYYGDYYSNYGLDENVLTLNLLTDKLSTDSNGSLQGTGEYLVLSDIFISSHDTLLPTGTYTVVDTITEVAPYTLLAGNSYTESTSSDTTPFGAYIYYFENTESRNTIKYITDGSFTVTQENDTTYNFTFDFTTKDKKNLKGTFSGVLYHYDESIYTLAGMKRKSRILEVN